MDQGNSWPYVLKPRWIHDLLLLWRRKQPYELYLDHVTEYSVREMRDRTNRRRCISWLASHFAPSRAAVTLNQNVWASYSHHFQINELAPAYLAQLILAEPLARQVTTALHAQVTPGMALGRSLFAEIQGAPGALDAWLRTLLQWGLLTADPRQGGYMVDKPLCVSPHSFSLLVWVWWLETRQATVTPDAFSQLSLWTWFDTSAFALGWQRFSGPLWTLESAGGEPAIFIHPTEPAAFTRSLLNLLSVDGRRGRQLPRQEDHGDAFADPVNLRQGILGR